MESLRWAPIISDTPNFKPTSQGAATCVLDINTRSGSQEHRYGVERASNYTAPDAFNSELWRFRA